MIENQPDSRYHRQMLLPDWGADKQALLARANVLIVGVGGLGCPVAQCLAGAGVGHIGLVDEDKVSLTNLHRQLLYDETQLGHPKVLTAAERLGRLNAEVRITPHYLRLTADNAATLVSNYDLVVDGCDNYATRYLIDDCCAAAGRPYVYGAVCGYEGQASVFHCASHSRRYRDLYPDEPAMCALPAPDKAIVATVPGVVGNVMAQQVLQLIAGADCPLAGRLWTIDLRTLQTGLYDL